MGHFTEVGYNGVEFTDASHCWARDLNILNGDTLLSFYRSSFCTADGIRMGVTNPRNSWGIGCSHAFKACSLQEISFTNQAASSTYSLCSTKPRNSWGIDCHHGLNASSSQDILFTNWEMNMKCWHDVTVFNHTVGLGRPALQGT
eukprot:366067-Chlamydomonas_euryale.AAC.2